MSEEAASSLLITETARQRLQTLGQRVTPARLAVLATLLDSPNALSHHEVAAKVAVSGERCDRVTLYRVLEWLVERGLAHKVAGEDRSWRFGAMLDESHEHPHFRCLCCGKVLCLDTLRPALILGLPTGYTIQRAEITIQGTCPDCSP
ncbi:MAG: Fur family transcriptional regulator [Candidatus Contendobacter sp.]|nr:Fur family transcriptional regulator [Candidatus Contendobacter sp.]